MICAVIVVCDRVRGRRFLREEALSQEQSPKVQLGIDRSNIYLIEISKGETRETWRDSPAPSLFHVFYSTGLEAIIEKISG